MLPVEGDEIGGPILLLQQLPENFEAAPGLGQDALRILRRQIEEDDGNAEPVEKVERQGFRLHARDDEDIGIGGNHTLDRQGQILAADGGDPARSRKPGLQRVPQIRVETPFRGPASDRGRGIPRQQRQRQNQRRVAQHHAPHRGRHLHHTALRVADGAGLRRQGGAEQNDTEQEKAADRHRRSDRRKPSPST